MHALTLLKNTPVHIPHYAAATNENKYNSYQHNCNTHKYIISSFKRNFLAYNVRCTPNNTICDDIADAKLNDEMVAIKFII